MLPAETAVLLPPRCRLRRGTLNEKKLVMRRMAEAMPRIIQTCFHGLSLLCHLWRQLKWATGKLRLVGLFMLK